MLGGNVIGNLVVKLSADINDFTTKMAAVEAKTAAIGSKLSSMSKTMTMGVTLPLVAIGGAAFKMSNDFNGAMANVATLVPGNVQHVNDLKASVQDLAIETGKSTDDLANGLYQVISALGDTEDTMDYLALAAKAAKSGVADTSDAVNLMAANMKGFGDMSEEMATKTMDMAFMTVKLGQTTFPELASSMQGVIPIAATLGVTQDELFGSFATLTGVTGNTSEVATQLTSVLGAMMQPTQGMIDAMAKLGYATSEGMLAELGFQGALEALMGTTDGTSMAVGELFGRKEALNAAFALTGSQAEVYAEKLAQVKDASGALNEAWAEQTNGVNATGFALSQLKQQLIVTFQRLGDAIAPVILTMLKALQPLINGIVTLATKFSNLGDRSKTVIVGFAMVAAAIGPMLTVVGKLLPFVGKAITTLMKLKPVLVALTGPVGVVVIAIAALIAIFVYLYKTNEDFRAKVQNAWETIKASITAAIEYITPYLQQAWELIKQAAQVAWDAIMFIVETAAAFITYVWDTYGAQITAIVSAVWGILTITIKTAVDVIKGIVQFFTALLKGDWKGAWDAVKSITSSVVAWLQSTFGNLRTIISNVLSIIIGILTDLVGKAGEYMGRAASTIWEKMRGVPGQMLGIGGQIIEGLKNGILGALGGLWDTISDVASGIVSGISNALDIFSPSRKMLRIGKFIVQGLNKGMEDLMPTTIHVAGQLGAAVEQNVTPQVPAMGAQTGWIAQAAGRGTTVTITTAPVINIAKANDDAEIERAVDKVVNGIKKKMRAQGLHVDWGAV